MGVARSDGALVAAGVAGRVRIIVVVMRAVAVLVGVLRHAAALGSAFVPMVGFVLAPRGCPAVGVARSDGALVAAGVAGRVRIIVVVMRAVAVLVGVLRHAAALGSAFVPMVGFVLAPRGCPAVGVARSDGALVATGVALGVGIVGVVVRAVAVLAGVLRHVAALSSAVVPVVGFIIAPCSCPAVGVARSDGALVATGVALGVGIVGVVVRAVAVLAGVLRHVAALSSAVVPVVGFIIAPCSCPAVGVRRARCQLQLFLAVIVDMGIFVIREEIA